MRGSSGVFASGLEFVQLKKSRFSAQIISGLLLAAATLGLTACANIIYHEPQYQYAGRAVPPSGLLQRVLATYTLNGSQGGAEILDGLRDTRSNVQDTIKYFFVSGFSAPVPTQILNFPEQERGYVFSQTDGALGIINYATEGGAGTAASFGAYAPSAAAAPDGTRFAGAVNGQGILEVVDHGATYGLSLPNVDKVVINQGNSVILAMVRNSNALYRVIKLPNSTSPVVPPGAIDCEPLQVPLYCVVPVGPTTGPTLFDRPIDAYFSLDGSSVYIVNCGPECGGTRAGITVLQQGALQVDQIPSTDPRNSTPALTALPVPNPIPIPGGATTMLSDGVNLYIAGQSLQTGSQFSGQLFGGNLTIVPLSTYVPSAPLSISDGTHTRILLADDSTLWIGSSQCANGVRAAVANYELAHTSTTDQAGNYNCLTAVKLGATPVATIVPAVAQSTGSAPATQVAFPNTDGNEYYYGNLTGICWVQGWHKVYTAYGGQIHVFYTGGAITDTDEPGANTPTPLGSEANNQYVTVQGTVLDVAYMDALSNSAN